MKNSRKKLIVIVMALVTIMAVSGTAAYFTSTDEATNTWTVGKVSVELLETDYEKYRAQESRNITPNCELHKDPKASNTGTNDAFVFMKIKVPKATVSVVDQDGTRTDEPVLQELFDYKWNNGWTVLESREVGSEASGLYQEYVVVYGTTEACTVLEPGDSTPVVFMNAIGTNINNPGKSGLITFKNIVEGQGLENVTLDMNVETYAIQTENLTTADTNNPDTIWDIVTAQTTLD